MRKVELTEQEAALVDRIVERELRDQISARAREKQKITYTMPDGLVALTDEAERAEFEYLDNTVKLLWQIKAKLEREEE